MEKQVKICDVCEKTVAVRRVSSEGELYWDWNVPPFEYWTNEDETLIVCDTCLEPVWKVLGNLGGEQFHQMIEGILRKQLVRASLRDV